jgi:hypothetical protein
VNVIDNTGGSVKLLQKNGQGFGNERRTTL